jgi:3-carboxy-cis,cis-muconate cycloisomerase
MQYCNLWGLNNYPGIMNYHSAIFSKYLGDEQLLQLVSDEALINKMLQFEKALAKAQASIGIIPANAADEINNALTQLKINPADLAAGTLQNGIPVISLLSMAKEKLSGDAKKYLHYGATSQDAMDTAQVLIIRDATHLIEERINTLIQKLTQLVKHYGETPCMAHSRGQQAIPITFGIKVNAWTNPLQRQLQRLREIKKRVLIVQLGGAAGTLAVYPDKAEELIVSLAKELKLQAASSWHTQRDNLCEFTNWLAMLTGILGKMGADILVMGQSEINEVQENTDGGKSSAMPHKNNPVLSEALVALARLNATLQSQQLQSLVHVNERDATAWILEWSAVPQMIINTGTALNHAISISSSLRVNTENMKRNVELFLKAQ